MAGFVDLSMEIRIMIYEYCLVKNYPFVPYNKEYYYMSDVRIPRVRYLLCLANNWVTSLDKDHQTLCLSSPIRWLRVIGADISCSQRPAALRKDEPAMALLRVSKTIEAEALPVLYGRNVWRITIYAPLMDIPIPQGPRWNSLWDRRSELIKHVVLVLDQRDIDVDDYVLATRVNHAFKADWPSDHWKFSGHGEARDNMYCTWDLKFEHLEQLPNLRSIELDVGGLFCYFGCCRQDVLQVLVEELERRFTKVPRLPTLLKPGSEIVIRGIRGDNERRIMRYTNLPFPILEEEFWDPKEYRTYE